MKEEKVDVDDVQIELSDFKQSWIVEEVDEDVKCRI